MRCWLIAAGLAFALSLAPARAGGGFGPLKEKLAKGSDASLLWIADSTGFQPFAPPREVARALALRFPTHSVRYRRWAEYREPPTLGLGPASYDRPEVLHHGTTGAVLDIWNATFPGKVPQTMMGSRFRPAILAPRPDVVVWLHGHNLLGDEPDRPDLLGAFWGPIGQVGAALPKAGQVAVIQNPHRLNDRMASVLATLQTIAAASEPPMTLVREGYAAFRAGLRRPTLYAEFGDDPTHPSPMGYDLLIRAVMTAFDAAPAGIAPATPAWPLIAARNLLADGDFTARAGALAEGWSRTPAGALRQTVPAQALRGRRVTLAVQVDIPEGVGPVGPLTIETDGSRSGSNAATFLTEGRGGPTWRVLADVPVPADATRLVVTLPGTPVRIERAVLVEGAIPRGRAVQ